MSLELKQVSGGYGQRKVIDHLTFKIESGEVMGLDWIERGGEEYHYETYYGIITTI